MKRLIYLFSGVALLSMILSACGGVQSPTDAPTLAPATQSPATESPLATDISTDTPTAVPIDLAGPLMEVGSFYTYVDGSILAAVPGGPFLMGFKNFADSIEHYSTVSDFWIYTNEVTNQQFELCVGAGKCAFPDKKDNPAYGDYRYVNFPVVGVNYDQAASYCGFVHGRLPTEAEWEKAARGPEGNLFPWGDAAPNCNLLNHDFCVGKLMNVLSYPDGISFYGLSDMSGNVREWVADRYQLKYDLTASTDPLGPAFGDKQSVRSSGFADGGDYAYSAHRLALKPVEHLPDLGFRCVVDDPTFFAPYCQGLILYGADVNGNPTNDVIPLPANCKQSTIDVATDCKTTPDNFITPNVEPGAQLNMPGSPQCQGGPDTWQCSGSGTVSIDPQVCVIPPPPGGGTCAPGYQESADPNDPNKKICTGQGIGTECLAGFTYNPLTQCCSADNPGPHAYGICPPGFYQQGNACIPAGSNPPPLVPVSVSFSPVPSCPDIQPGCDPATDPACSCAPQACRVGVWDSTLCGCRLP